MAISKTASPEEKVLDYIEVTGAVLEKSAALLAEKEAQAKQCEALIPKAVEALLAHQRIELTEKAAALEALKNPVTVLEVLINTARHRNSAEQTKIGEPVDAKGQTKKASAGYNSLSDSYVGRRSRPDEPESSKAFKRGLGF